MGPILLRGEVRREGEGVRWGGEGKEGEGRRGKGGEGNRGEGRGKVVPQC